MYNYPEGAISYIVYIYFNRKYVHDSCPCEKDDVCHFLFAFLPMNKF